MTASKDDAHKPKLELLLPEFQEEMAVVRELGNKKYGVNDWQRGMSWSKLIGSALRHINALKRGDMYDNGPTGDGRKHSAHVATCMEMLDYYHRNSVFDKFDDLGVSGPEVDGFAKFDSQDRVAELQARIVAWADGVFPDRTAEDALKKLIMEEIPELLTSSRADDPLEWADIFILVLDIASLLKLDLIAVAHDKMSINEKRKWKKNYRSGLISHIEENTDG